MVSLADIFNNAKIKVQNNELYNKLLGQEYNQVPLVKELPQIKPVQMREDGSIYEIEQPIEKKPTLMQRAANIGYNAQDAINNIGSKLGDYLLGEQDITTAQDKPIKDENGNLIPSNTISATPRRGGVLRDIAEGYRENRNTPFSIDNLGGRKTFANRFGEAVGTVSRIAASPLGRGLIMAGIVGATGGGALPALGFGTVATVKNQQNRMKDELYRNNIIRSMQESLKNSPGFEELTPEEQNAQLQKIADSVNAYRGYLGDDTYRQILTGLQLQDNAEYRNALLANNQRNQELANRIAQERFDYTKQQDAKKLALDWEKLKVDKEKRGTASFSEISSLRKEFSAIPAIKNYNEIKRQVGNVTNTYNAYKSGKLRANVADQTMVTTLNKILDPNSVVRESEFARTAAGQALLARIEGYANKMTKGGGGLTNAEREDLYTAMMEMYKANEDEANAYIQSYTDLANRYGINPADIMPRQYYQSSQIQSTTNNDPLGIRG